MVELLSPAGSFEGFLGALNAGADAVYLGGEKYSARAYAENFTAEQIVEALDVAHFYGKKIYLALNTLLKDDEVEPAADFLEPLYEHDLDGVIIQDLGLSSVLLKRYPGLALHASTQMNITGAEGAGFLRDKGFTRVVPARELGLEEIRKLKQDADMEVECFVHGAMCYCYSGQCLFSSVLGGRSGNRGRCAQPCRLPYSVHIRGIQGKSSEGHPLSMKDLCTVYMLPDLIEAGIDSFKIEGRMKHPAYTCGVTALYRKYIDRYMEYGRESAGVSEEDTDRLLKLYIRSDIHDGYYRKHNGSNMLASGQSGYKGSDDGLVRELEDTYLKAARKHPVTMQVFLETGKPARLCITDGTGLHAEAEGASPEPAASRPLTREEVKKQLQKTGNSLLVCDDVSVHMKDGLYIPVGALNRLRRDGVSLFEAKVRTQNGYTGRSAAEQKGCGAKKAPGTAPDREDISARRKKRPLHVSVLSLEQMEALADLQAERLYVDADLWWKDRDAVVNCVGRYAEKPDIYLMLPYISRAGDRTYYEQICEGAGTEGPIKGVLVRNLEQVRLLQKWKQKHRDSAVRGIGDAGLYQMNRFAGDLTDGILDEYTLPYELNHRETRWLCAENRRRERPMAQIIYGRIPMMISANCIKKTENRCDRIEELSERQYLEDRYKKRFPVYNNCVHCYNVIYNSVPYSLHNKIDQISQNEICAFRMDFVTEKKSEVQKICRSFSDALSRGKAISYAPPEFTAGHFARGIE